MTPSLVPIPAPGRSRLRRLAKAGARLRAVLPGVALLLGLSAASAAPAPSAPPDLGQLERMVRGGDGGALVRLRQAADGYGAQAPYADQVRYLRLLAQAYHDAGEPEAASAIDARLLRLASAQGDTVDAALGALGRVSEL